MTANEHPNCWFIPGYLENGSDLVYDLIPAIGSAMTGVERVAC